jgi:hypothetical protein
MRARKRKISSYILLNLEAPLRINCKPIAVVDLFIAVGFARLSHFRPASLISMLLAAFRILLVDVRRLAI